MTKSYFIHEWLRHENYSEEGKLYVWHSYAPHVVLLDVDSETFILELYEKAYEFMATGKDLLDEGNTLVEICGVKIELKYIVDDLEGDFNYNVKDINVIDLKDIKPTMIGKASDNLFFVEQKHYLAETEDDFKMVYSLIACESEEVFKDIYKQQCEKSCKKDESVMFNGLFFDGYDAYAVNRHKKIEVHYPNLTPVE